MELTIPRIFTLSCLVSNTIGYVLPTVNLTSCMGNTATVSISGTEEGGLVYFRTDQGYNMIPTSEGKMVHECAFEDCNINWDEKFYVIVQRRVAYQTRYDVILWFVCSTDFSAIQPVNIDFGAIADGNLTTVTYKPEVSMILTSKGVQLQERDGVLLGDNVLMEILVTNDDGGYFDIRARSCYAAGITLIEDYCAIDEYLFPQFNSSSLGYLRSTFAMFRPTHMSGGPVDVVFTCILEVCLWNCEEFDCTFNSTEGNRKKREAKERRKGSEENNLSIARGFILRALAEGEEAIVKIKPLDDQICFPLYAMIATLGFFAAFITASMTVYACSFHRHQLYVRIIATVKGKKDGNQGVVCVKVSEEKEIASDAVKSVKSNVQIQNDATSEDRSKSSSEKELNTLSSSNLKRSNLMNLLLPTGYLKNSTSSYRRKSLTLASS